MREIKSKQLPGKFVYSWWYRHYLKRILVSAIANDAKKETIKQSLSVEGGKKRTQSMSYFCAEVSVAVDFQDTRQC